MDSYIKETFKLYREKNAIYGKGHPKNLWNRVESQSRRFQKFVDSFDFNGKSILDVGCGYGDFYHYLVNKRIKPESYTGCDIMPEHCKVAKENLPGECKIVEGDILKEDFPQVDICVLSGTLNAQFDCWLEISTKILDKMWSLSSEGMIFNMQSSHGLKGEYAEQVLQSRNISPGYWAQYAHDKTCKYGIFHNYMHYDYTIAMWKADIGWQEQ